VAGAAGSLRLRRREVEPLSWLFLILIFVFAAFGILGCRAAYRNGVTDGFGYSMEPFNPGYQLAGEYLRKHLAHRWPELKEVPTDE
jgi:hypothetical protein